MLGSGFGFQDFGVTCMKLDCSSDEADSQEVCIFVTPAHAGVQNIEAPPDSGFRRNGKKGKIQVYLAEHQVSFLVKLATLLRRASLCGKRRP
jgi:hypothetical protein